MTQGYQIRDQHGIHFVTLTVVEWLDVLSNELYREIFIDCIIYCQSNKHFHVHAWVIMSNHIHLIVSTSSPSTLSSNLRDLKKYSAYKIVKAIGTNESESRKSWLMKIFRTNGRSNMRNVTFQFWIQDNHPVLLDSNFMLDQRLKYVHDNPVKAGIVRRPEDYIYSSAAACAGMKDEMIELVFID